jgi:hypothetical protein
MLLRLLLPVCHSRPAKKRCFGRLRLQKHFGPRKTPFSLHSSGGEAQAAAAVDRGVWPEEWR